MSGVQGAWVILSFNCHKSPDWEPQCTINIKNHQPVVAFFFQIKKCQTSHYQKRIPWPLRPTIGPRDAFQLLQFQQHLHPAMPLVGLFRIQKLQKSKIRSFSTSSLIWHVFLTMNWLASIFLAVAAVASASLSLTLVAIVVYRKSILASILNKAGIMQL